MASLTIDLSSGAVAQRITLTGKYLAVDAASTGYADVRYNSLSDNPRRLLAGYKSESSFTDLFFDYLAQPGKKIILVYGDTIDITAFGAQVLVDPVISSGFLSRDDTSNALVTLIDRSVNIRGIKIQSGVIVLYYNSGGVSVGETVALLSYTDLFNQIIFTTCEAAVNTITPPDDRKFAQVFVPPLYIPPRQFLYYQFVISGGGFGSGSLMLNYDILK